ncbi:MAG: DUF58 domain-containing protein [Verrucomicrobia bacterium]|nr:DUF58 domain-containing protein [Verrucomicrobiota bacterium]
MRLVPNRRLLFVVGALLVPMAATGAALPWMATTAVVFAAALGIAAVADAFLGRRALRGVQADVPAVSRLTQDRETELPIRLRNETGRPQRLRLGLAFPREFRSPHEDLWVTMPSEPVWSRLTWPCTSSKRGRYSLDAVHVECASPFGLWDVRTALPARTELRVYPNLARERKQMAAFFLNRGDTGIHTQRQVGRGRDFEKLREYVPGDDYQDIHWKTTAKRARPITKVFQVERTQEVYVVLDATRLSARSAGDATMLERFVTAALVLGLAAEKQGDLFGLVTFSDKVDRFVRAKNGKAHYGVCRDALYMLQARTVTPDFDELCAFLRLRLRRRALLLFLTSMDDPLLAESFTKHIELISRQHLILVNMPRPSGIEPLFTGAEIADADGVYERLGGHVLWQNLRERERVLGHRGVSFQLLEHDTMCASLIAQYLNVKRRQLL